MTGRIPVHGGLLLVHAHPDDETLLTGGTIAHYRREDIPVTVLTCTLGEEGEVLDERWAGLRADRADQLGGYRILELTRALTLLGVYGPRLLGGAGRWRDSGMVDTGRGRHPRSFVDSGIQAVRELVDVLLEVRPAVVVGYDPAGGYGHRDHVRAHQITAIAVTAAASRGWDVPKFYWTVTDREVLTRELADIAHRTDNGKTLPAEWRFPKSGELGCVASDMVTTTIDVSAVLPAKKAALKAHATQIELSESGREFVLENRIIQPVLSEEHFILVKGALGPRDATGRETDLFAAPAT